MIDLAVLSGLLAVGFLLGLEHATDPDHIAATSSLVQKGVKQASLIGLSWGAGHTTTLLVVGMIILLFKVSIPNRLALGFEFLVGVMLVVLGALALRRGLSRHAHSKDHFHIAKLSEKEHHQRRAYLVGLVHGLAGSAALMLLVLATSPDVVTGLAFILVFGIGSIGGMLFLSSLIGIPFSLTSKKYTNTHRWLHSGAGLVSVAIGLLVMWQIGSAFAW